ncbi:MAG: hypothetical protein KIS76_11470 [Pyrinomonadaceae bacterium]|nr:hypothetical protein [Pyrinomonadaceae bacterium]
MKKLIAGFATIAAFIIVYSVGTAHAQNKLLKRTTYKTDSVKSGAGGTLSIIGSPKGSISIEGWQKRDVDISAEITVEAENEADLAQLAAVVGFMTDPGMNHTRIVSVGPHDRKYLKTVSKKFPKRLLEMPYRIDYKIMVPAFSDLEIDGGTGDLIIKNVEGTMRINYLESNADLELIGGTVTAAFGKGIVDITVPVSSWRGRTLDVQLISGEMNVNLLENLNAEIDAKILKTGSISNQFENWEKRDRTAFTDKLINAKAGGGGSRLTFSLGAGTMNLRRISPPAKP